MADAQVTVDTTVCSDCLREMFDPSDRRFGYPFINCTNCGPRYSIVSQVPYDRPNTTMAGFTLCRQCAAEYADPADRRYHAQPIACPECGPKVWLADTHGRIIETENPISAAAELLREGKIVAIKGLGGFQLAVRADDDHAVRRLRLRKNRQAKPFALMVADLDTVARLVELPDPARELLTGPRGPIVLLPRRANSGVADSVAPGTDVLGVMLPTTPLHHLLFSEVGKIPLVMTSGNMTDEPLAKDNEDAVAHLGQIADALLLHDRPIERRVDDSVITLDGAGALVPVRRARGYAPTPLKITSAASRAILAVGAELKSTFCLYHDGRALVSEHLGDLKDGRVYRQYLQTIAHLESLYAFTPQLLAADMHPGYLSTQYAVQRSRGRFSTRPVIPLVLVQHHHAHIAAVLAEHSHSGPVIGIAADGTGYGPDGAVWGGEILQADLAGYRRLGHLRYLGLPGGDLAASETYRPAVSVLAETFGRDAGGPLRTDRLGLDAVRLQMALEQINRGANCPPSSSLGRLFDAVSALCGLARQNAFEGQAAIALEAAADKTCSEAYHFEIQDDSPFVIDYRPMVVQLSEDLANGVGPHTVAAKFHNTAADFLAAGAERARELTGLSVVALSGGCFANRMMTARLLKRLAEKGFTVLMHRKLPCNDGCISLGQAAVAASVPQKFDSMPEDAGDTDTNQTSFNKYGRFKE